MEVRELSVAGAFEVTPVQHADERGLFLEWFREDAFTGIDRRARSTSPRRTARSPAPARCAASTSPRCPPGQAKFVTCVQGAAFDVAVDLRVGSPTYGQWDAVLLDDRDRRATYLPDGVRPRVPGAGGQHGGQLPVLRGVRARRDHGINPLDPAIAIEWPTIGRDGATLTRRLSPRDAAAPTLAETRELGVLPTYEDARA